jgi:hypothetical protein
MPNKGNITPSQFKKIMTNPRSKKARENGEWSQTAITYANELVLARLGVERDEVNAASLEWGNTWEPIAIERYEDETGSFPVSVDKSIFHPQFDFVCGKPDGLVNADGIIEIKSPFNPLNHLANIETAAQYEDYKYQIQGYLWITGRSWCDFVSYDHRFPEPMQIAIHRIERDPEIVSALESKIIEFEKFIVAKLEKLQKKL